MTIGCLDFSEKTVFTGPQPSFSPDKQHVALAQDYRLVVRDVETLAVVGLFSCLDRIEALAWSPCGEHILCGLYKRGSVQVFSVTDPEWTCSISEGLAGIVSARWCPNGEQILLTAEFQVKLSVWSLVDQSCHQLPPPKHPEAGLAFSPDGTMLAVIQRWECKDSLQIYDVSTWESISHVAIPTSDAADLSWSPDSSCLAVWDDLAQGPLAAVFSIAGECLATHRGSGGTQSHGLGFKSVSWSPSGQLLAIGTSEQDLGVLNHVTWTPLTTFAHPSVVAGPASVVVYQEKQEISRVLQESSTVNRGGTASAVGSKAQQQQQRGNKGSGTAIGGRPPPLSVPKGPSAPSSRNGSPTKPSSTRPKLPGTPPPSSATVAAAAAKLSRQLELADEGDDAGDDVTSRFIVAQLPLRLTFTKPSTDRPNPKMGIGKASWSFDGSLLATRCDARPNTIWVWDSSTLELTAMMTLTAPVKALEWDPSGKRRLVAGCGSGRLYVWTPEGASVVRVPVPGVKAVGLKWTSDGSALMVVGRDAFCCAYMGA